MDNAVSVIIDMGLALVCSFVANDSKIVIMQRPLKKKTDIFYLTIDIYLYLTSLNTLRLNILCPIMLNTV